MPNDAIVKVSWWHEAIVDWMIMYPEKTLTECAQRFEVTLPWLSRVVNSDCFLTYKAARMAEHQDNISTSVLEKVEGLTHGALDILNKRVQENPDQLTFNALKETAELGLKAMGYTGRSNGAVQIVAPGGNVQVNQNVATPAVLASAREKMRELQHQNAKKLESIPAAEVLPATS